MDFRDGKRISQFGSAIPSADALVTAAHLPVVEIREMLDEDTYVRQHKQESVHTAAEVYRRIAKPVADLAYADYARSLAAFIRSEFRIKETRLERFVKHAEPLAGEELRGGLIFFGKGRCVVCHGGPYFSDFAFHAVAFPQMGFGKNGFGVDYGRFNVTFDPRDLYKFRTPPLYNVEKTAPYGHSGSVATLAEAVVAHFDPLRLAQLSAMRPFERHEFYKRLTVSAETATTVGFLSEADVSAVVRFLTLLSF